MSTDQGAVGARAHIQIPGFTFDERTKRYIKILPNHHARSMGGEASKASNQNVNEQTVARKRQKREEVNRQTRPVQRSKALSNPMIRSGLQAQIGQQINAANSQAAAWCNLLENVDQKEPPRGCEFTLMQKSAGNDSLVTLQVYGHEASAEIRLTGVGRGRLGCCCAEVPLMYYKYCSMDIVGGYIHLITWGREWPNLMIPIPGPHEGRECIDRTTSTMIVTKPDGKHDYWCTSHHPDISRPRLAVGMESCVQIQDMHHSGRAWVTSTYKSARPTSSSQNPALCLKWKSEHILLAGHRDATMSLFDMRAKAATMRLRHETSIMRLHSVDDNKILLSGPNHLDMYDLRYNKAPHQTRASRPWMKYPNYDTKEWRQFDLDVSPRLGLLALSLDKRVELWDMWTGQRLRTMKSGQLSDVNAHHVSFTRKDHPTQFFQEQNDPVGLLVGMDRTVVEWDITRKGGPAFVGQELD